MADIIPLIAGDENTDSWYEDQYKQARRIDVLGIACIDVIIELCGVGAGAAANRNRGRLGRLSALRESTLFQRLQGEHFDLRIVLINPFCGFARTRTEEERNPSCRGDILDSIERLEGLYKFLRDDPDAKRISIKGRVEVAVIDDNPYISLTCVTPRDGGRQIVVGFLVPGGIADTYPKLLFDHKIERFTGVFEMANHVIVKQEDMVFRWDRSVLWFSPKFAKPEGFDIFLCHNSRDKERVDKLRAKLRVEGIGTWMDRWEIKPGDLWIKELEEVLPKVRVAAVCIGSNDIGPWEAMEVYCLFDLHARGQTRLIPVILDGVDGEPRIPGFLKQFQWVDLRKGEGELRKLVKIIREGRPK
jgi:hypothetical protein